MQAGKVRRCLHSSVTILQDLSTEDRFDLGGPECLHYTVGAMAARFVLLDGMKHILWGFTLPWKIGFSYSHNLGLRNVAPL
jgi:hypothetical protein